MLLSTMPLFIGIILLWCPVSVSARAILQSPNTPTAFSNTADEDRILLSSSRGRRAVTNISSFLWKEGIIPYQFSEAVKKEKNVHDAIIEAMSRWEKYTCLRFVPYEKGRDYLLFTTSADGPCSTAVGRMGYGSQAVQIGMTCTPLDGVAMHEIGHSIGFWHEHTRPDRDSYVEILKGNILDDHLRDFEIRPASEIDSLGIPYDLDSIMHYKLDTFSRNNQPTIRVIENFTGTVGQRFFLSDKDILQANKLYNCEDLTRRRPIGCNGEVQNGNTIALRIEHEQKTRGLGHNWLRCKNGQFCSPTETTCAGYQFDGRDWNHCKHDTFRIYSRDTQGLDETIHIGDTVVLESGANSGYWLSCFRGHKCKLKMCDSAISNVDDGLCPGRYFTVVVLGHSTGDILKDQQTIGLLSSSTQYADQYFSCKSSRSNCRKRVCSSDSSINKQGNWTSCAEAQFTITKSIGNVAMDINCTFANGQ